MKHEVIGASYFVVSSDHSYYEKLHLFRGTDCVERFLDSITITSARLKAHVVNGHPLHLSAVEEQQFQAATSCYLCGHNFVAGDSRHRDHDHISGAYRGATHAKCNINHRLAISHSAYEIIIRVTVEQGKTSINVSLD